MAARKDTPRSPAKRPPRRPVRNHNAIITMLLVTCGLATLLIGSALAWFLSLDIPDIRSFADYRPLVSTTVLDRSGRIIDEIYEENRIVLRFEELNPLIPKAFVAAEDGRYWEHGGLDAWSIARALIANLRSGRRSQGGSTITQQVTRALMLTREKSYSRKVKEALLSYRLDKMLSKEEILAIYLNEIYLGEGAHGVEAAARTYFGKKSRQLSLAEIAILAGLPQSPSRYSPLTHFAEAQARQRYVLNRMADEGYITPEAARQAFQQTLHFRNHKEQQDLYGYFTQYVRQLLEQRFGREKLLRQGLVVTTTLDPRLQAEALRTIREGTAAIGKRLPGNDTPQGALVALEAKTGRVRALVGGTDFGESPFNRAVQANRQPGSVFKPLVYATAFAGGISPDEMIDDAPFAIRNPDGSAWSPKNYDNTYGGPTSLREGLIHSRNIVAIKLLQKIGVKPVIRLAGRAGITSPLRPELTLALGASPVSLLEMTGAYTVFANQGRFATPVCITRVTDRGGKELPWPAPGGSQVIDTASAQQVSSLLAEVISRGTGKKAQGIPGSAGKTGTTDNNRDGWFIGYTADTIAGVWVGFDRGRSLGSGETGGQTAAPIWLDFMGAGK
jgi:penicillin-binding protein 1A